jgi:hypothetical protein
LQNSIVAVFAGNFVHHMLCRAEALQKVLFKILLPHIIPAQQVGTIPVGKYTCSLSWYQLIKHVYLLTNLVPAQNEIINILWCRRVTQLQGSELA